VTTPLPEIIAGRYRVIRELARGGMGVVYGAELAASVRARLRLRPALRRVVSPIDDRDVGVIVAWLGTLTGDPRP
jgi:hypothetical protein